MTPECRVDGIRLWLAWLGHELAHEVQSIPVDVVVAFPVMIVLMYVVLAYTQGQ